MLHVKCPQCAASYKLSEDLYRRKAAGFGVVVTCRHCKTEIHVQDVDDGQTTPAKAAVDAGVFDATPAAPTPALPPPVAPRPAVLAPRPGGPPRPATPPRPGGPPRPGAAARLEPVTPSPTPTRALPSKANDATKDAPRLVALSPGLLGVGSSLDKEPPSSGPDTDRDSEPPASEDPPTQRPPPPISDSDAPQESELPVASTDFLDSMADSAPALDSRDYVEEPPAPEPPKPRLPQAPPVRRLPAPARAAQDEPPSNTSAPKIDQLVHPPAPPDKAERKGPPRKRQASGDLTDDMLSADLGFDAPIALAPPDATALTRPPVSERPAAPAAASTKPVSTSDTRQPAAQKSSARGFLWVLALVLLAGGAFAFRDRFTGGKAAPAAQAPAPEPPAAPPPTPATAAPEPEPESAPAASAEPPPVAEPATAAPEPTPPATAAATARAPSPKPAPEPVAASEPATPATKPTATAAPIPEPPRGEATGPFDVAAARSSLEAAAAQASSCRKPGDPSGVAVVTITFSPSGRVTSANIGGPPFAATSTGGCIASTLRKARVPPFIGEMVTIRKTVTIQ